MSPLPEPLLSDGVVSLRPWRLEDLALVRTASSEPELLPGTTLPHRYSPSEGRAFIERQWARAASHEGITLVIESRGTAVGCASVMLRRPGVGTSATG